jgi:4-amino-4-deoxy-L-arabinose transferase-like glycosyltransferase
MMKTLFKKTSWVLGVIILIAAFLRFFQLGINPPSLTWDEVAWGYNAYSLGIDGKDEFGKFLPYDYFESFGDFKPPVYAYLDVIPVKLFGLNEFAVRFPSAVFGTLTVLVTYFLVRRMFFASAYARMYALLTSLLLAISPWHIMLSRAAFEANVASFFIITGIWLFLEALVRKKWLLILSAISFVLSFYTFNSARVVTPLLVLGLVFVFRKKLFQLKKVVATTAIVGLFLFVPLIPFLLSPQASLRYREVNIFSDINLIQRANQEIANDNNSTFSKVIHNRRLIFSVEYLKHYFDNLSPSFLFIKGDGNPKFSTQAVGQMYIFELPFFIAGILFLIRKREKNWWLVPFWIIAAIIPAATARETPHALRIETALPMFQLLVAYGMVHLFLVINNYKMKLLWIKKLAYCLFLVFALYVVSYYFEDYFVHYPKAYSSEWQYGYKDAIAYIDQVEKNYNKIYLTKELGRPYMYMLFYKQYDPTAFRKEAEIERNAFGFVDVLSFGKYYFEKESLKKTGEKNVLFIDSPVDVPNNAKIKKTFYFLDGSVAIVSYTL